MKIAEKGTCPQYFVVLCVVCRGWPVAIALCRALLWGTITAKYPEQNPGLVCKYYLACK